MTVELSGLDASNPRDFLATLGLLVVGPPEWAVSWSDHGAWRPVLHAAGSLDEVVGVVDRDRTDFGSRRVLTIEHAGKPDLKLPLDEVRSLFAELVEHADPDAHLVACLMSELVTDNSGVSKPTGWHFTAGQQRFVHMWRQLQQGVDAEAIRRDLVEVGPAWSKLPSMSWDNEGGHPYALRASDPSKIKRLSRPGLEWLGLRGLELLPSAPGGPRATRLDTALIRGRWGQATMTWPVWIGPARRAGVASLLLRSDWRRANPARRSALGIPAVFRATILRSESGGYGSFSPARQV